MATIRERTNKSGASTFQAIVRIAGHNPRRKSFPTRKQAVEWSEATATVLRSLTNPIADPKKFNKTLLSDAIDEYLSWPNGAKTFHAHLKSIKTHAGKATLGSINKNWLSQFVNRMKVTPTQYGRLFSEATLAKHITALRAVLKRQADLHHVQPDLIGIGTSILSPGWDKMRNRRLEAREETLLRQTFAQPQYTSQWTDLLTLALETAAREAELVMCHRSEFNLSERIWIIPAERTKAKKERQVPLSKSALAAVERLHTMLDQRNAALLKLDPLVRPETRLFWQFASASSVCTSFHRTIVKLGIIDLRFHDLRHESITRMVLHKRKLSVYEIMKIVGHESMAMLNRYANLRGGDLVDRME